MCVRVCDKMAEEQEDEIQALKAIYDADFAGMCFLLIFSGVSRCYVGKDGQWERQPISCPVSA